MRDLDDARNKLLAKREARAMGDATDDEVREAEVVMHAALKDVRNFYLRPKEQPLIDRYSRQDYILDQLREAIIRYQEGGSTDANDRRKIKEILYEFVQRYERKHPWLAAMEQQEGKFPVYYLYSHSHTMFERIRALEPGVHVKTPTTQSMIHYYRQITSV